MAMYQRCLKRKWHHSMGDCHILKQYLHVVHTNLFDLFSQKHGGFQALDGLRAIAIIQVILFHCFYLNYSSFPPATRDNLLVGMSPWFNWIWQGDKGVDLFFVLSGFLITMLLLKEFAQKGQVGITGFFKRRAGRILPAYLLLLLFGWVIDQPNSEWLWTNLLFINNMTSPETLYLPWSWSITVEVQFYIIFPLIILPILIYSGKPLTFASLFVIAAITIRQYVISNNYQLITTPFYEQVYDAATFSGWWNAVYIQLYTRAGPITFGVAAAVIHTYHSRTLDSFIQSHRGPTKLLLLFAFILFVFSQSFPYHIPQYEYLSYIGESGNYWLLGQHRNLFAFSCTLILLFALKPRGYYEQLYNFLRNRTLVYIAKVSYSAYLFHILLLKQIFQY
ncbi:MAG: acyltransferase, partial [Candidatus Thiodiazotropha sp. (ex Ustalcina ferruginea)]|nr:acyltransferase [Candidatus Thiodiazotropha sp. (ex Ustalcina ferruginea)]